LSFWFSSIYFASSDAKHIIIQIFFAFNSFLAILPVQSYPAFPYFLIWQYGKLRVFLIKTERSNYIMKQLFEEKKLLQKEKNGIEESREKIRSRYLPTWAKLLLELDASKPKQQTITGDLK
jgi:hypothetical protein